MTTTTTIEMMMHCVCLGGRVFNVLDLRSTGHGFKPKPPAALSGATLGKWFTHNSSSKLVLA